MHILQQAKLNLRKFTQLMSPRVRMLTWGGVNKRKRRQFGGGEAKEVISRISDGGKWEGMSWEVALRGSAVRRGCWWAEIRMRG